MKAARPAIAAAWLGALAWMLLLAMLPWWCALPLETALVVTVLIGRAPLPAASARLAMRLGLAGAVWTLPHALGGVLPAWCVLLLGALVGYTLLAGIEGWLDRVPAPRVARQDDAWPQLAFAPIGPTETLIELAPVRWLDGPEVLDPRGGGVRRERDGWRFSDGRLVEAAPGACAFSSDGRWFAAVDRDGRRLMLWRRDGSVPCRLHRWQLAGWHRGEPWIARHARAWPRPLASLASTPPRWGLR